MIDRKPPYVVCLNVATIHLMYGFIGFGKTTIAKKLAKEIPAIRLCIDDFNTKLFGRNPYSDGFGEYLKLNKELIWDITKETIGNGIDVIIDRGGVSNVKQRAEDWGRAKSITANVIYHVIDCDMETAKRRTLERTKDKNAIEITEQDFENALKRFEPMQDNEKKNYKVIYHEFYACL